MDLTVVFSVIVIVAGAIVGISTVVPRLKKIGIIGVAGQAIGQSLAGSASPDDDTPGRITPKEIAEAIEAGAGAVKNQLKDV